MLIMGNKQKKKFKNFLKNKRFNKTLKKKDFFDIINMYKGEVGVVIIRLVS